LSYLKTLYQTPTLFHIGDNGDDKVRMVRLAERPGKSPGNLSKAALVITNSTAPSTNQQQDQSQGSQLS
jgi:hypothetical protein